ncbi:MAG: hypothetical protein ABSC94_06255 [Polyangiaceae bacterium]
MSTAHPSHAPLHVVECAHLRIVRDRAGGTTCLLCGNVFVRPLGAPRPRRAPDFLLEISDDEPSY